MKILVINGPNLNMLGAREPEVYGSTTLKDIEEELSAYAKQCFSDVEIEFFQSNHEGAIVDKIQSAKDTKDGIIINPAAYTHTSLAIADALAAVSVPCVEVHLSNIHSREEFRHKSYCAKNCIGQICGFNKTGYKMALMGLVEALK